jgi:hypothetical protein
LARTSSYAVRWIDYEHSALHVPPPKIKYAIVHCSSCRYRDRYHLSHVADVQPWVVASGGGY